MYTPLTGDPFDDGKPDVTDVTDLFDDGKREPRQSMQCVRPSRLHCRYCRKAMQCVRPPRFGCSPLF